MNWNNTKTSFNLQELKVIRADNTLVCVCEKVEDAKLITAAPELLKALIDIVKISDRRHDAWDKAKEAIEKATTII
jgi:hypothetical protein